MIIDIKFMIAVCELPPQICRLVVNQYEDGSPCFRFHDQEDFEPYANGSIWVEGLVAGEIAIPEYKYPGIIASMYKAGLIDIVHRYIKFGYVIFPVCRLSPMALEYVEIEKQELAEDDAIRSEQERFELNKESYCDPDYGD